MEEEIRQIKAEIDLLKSAISDTEERANQRGSVLDYGVDFENINNFIEVVTTVPTHTPNNVYEQIKIYNDTGGGPAWALYIYDYVNHVWKSVTIA